MRGWETRKRTAVKGILGGIVVESTPWSAVDDVFQEVFRPPKWVDDAPYFCRRVVEFPLVCWELISSI